MKQRTAVDPTSKEYYQKRQSVLCVSVRVCVSFYKNISRIDSSVIVTEVVPDNVDQIQVYIYV